MNCEVLSIAMTSLMSSTTHTISGFLFTLLQISHKSVSEILKHFSQFFTSFLKWSNASDKYAVFSLGCFNKCNTKRKAVRFPIPGKRETSFTAFSNIFDEKSIVCKITILKRKKKKVEREKKLILESKSF